MLKSPGTRTLGTRTRLYWHQVLVLENFKSCVLVLKASVLDSSADKVKNKHEQQLLFLDLQQIIILF